MESMDDYYDDDTIRSIKKIEFCVWPNDVIPNRSVLKDTLGIEIADFYDNIEPKRGGLIDPRMGIMSYSYNCPICGLYNFRCLGHICHSNNSDNYHNCCEIL